MLSLLNMPHLTDAGAKELAAGAEVFGARATENLAKATQMVVGVVFVLGVGWLALAFYKESKRGGSVAHSVEHYSRTSR